MRAETGPKFPWEYTVSILRVFDGQPDGVVPDSTASIRRPTGSGIKSTMTRPRLLKSRPVDFSHMVADWRRLSSVYLPPSIALRFSLTSIPSLRFPRRDQNGFPYRMVINDIYRDTHLQSRDIHLILASCFLNLSTFRL